MNLELDYQDYNNWHSPLESVKCFFEARLTELGWKNGERDEIIMDIGCGPGGTTKNVVLPYFPRLEKIIAMDVMPGMIHTAKNANAHPKIEYEVADIADWYTLQKWEGKMTKIVSIHCLHWVKDQKIAFKNIYRLLMSGGEAALFFVVEATFFDAVSALQNSLEFRPFLENHDNGIPDSHHYHYEADHYINLATEIGFQVLHCRKEEKLDISINDEQYRNLFPSICALTRYVPNELRERFKDEMLLINTRNNGRTDVGALYHRGQMLEMVVRKN